MFNVLCVIVYKSWVWFIKVGVVSKVTVNWTNSAYIYAPVKAN